MVRLVKGAYWDSEIKRAQVDGLDDYPVYTRKAHTDVSYLACARRLLAAPDAVYPQFATHNAHTLAAIYQMAGPTQRRPVRVPVPARHGRAAVRAGRRPRADGGLGRPCRIYAPVGTHETLLAYLVRRLLENGANTSFVNRIADAARAASTSSSPTRSHGRAVAQRAAALGAPHPRDPAAARPVRRRRGATRAASTSPNEHGSHAARRCAACERRAALARGADASTATERTRRRGALDGAQSRRPRATSSARVVEATPRTTSSARSTARRARAARLVGDAGRPSARADASSAPPTRSRRDRAQLIGLLCARPARRCANAVARSARGGRLPALLRGAGARRELATARRPRRSAPVVCISPWNFPLAIFMGQVARRARRRQRGDREAGRADAAHRRRRRCGCCTRPAFRAARCSCCPVAARPSAPRWSAIARVRGVLFTGSTEVARLLQRSARRPRSTRTAGRSPLIAETGGQNAMIVDSSALLEQVVARRASRRRSTAPASAARRCACCACRRTSPSASLEMLRGAMARAARSGDPTRLATDVGPVIDAEAQRGDRGAHRGACARRGRRVHRPLRVDADALRARHASSRRR